MSDDQSGADPGAVRPSGWGAAHPDYVGQPPTQAVGGWGTQEPQGAPSDTAWGQPAPGYAPAPAYPPPAPGYPPPAPGYSPAPGYPPPAPNYPPYGGEAGPSNQWTGNQPSRNGRSKALIAVPVAVIVIAAAVIGIVLGANGGSSNHTAGSSTTPGAGSSSVAGRSGGGGSTATTGGTGSNTTVGIGTSTTISASATTNTPAATLPATTVPATTAPSHATTTIAAPDDDQIYLQTVRSSAPSLAALPNAQLIAVGHTSCTQLLAGTSLTDVITNVRPALRPAAPTDLDIAGLVGAAIGEYCPSASTNE